MYEYTIEVFASRAENGLDTAAERLTALSTDGWSVVAAYAAINPAWHCQTCGEAVSMAVAQSTVCATGREAGK